MDLDPTSINFVLVNRLCIS